MDNDGKIITKERSRSSGLIRIHRGKGLQYSHIDERRTSTGTCLTCKRSEMDQTKSFIENVTQNGLRREGNDMWIQIEIQ